MIPSFCLQKKDCKNLVKKFCLVLTVKMLSVCTNIKSWLFTQYHKCKKQKASPTHDTNTNTNTNEISLKNTKLDVSDNEQLMSSFFTTFVDGVKVAMASLLSVFVPQYCENSGTTCTLEENFTDLTTFNKFVLAWNFISLGCFIYTSILQNKREAYFISHLEESKEHTYNSLSTNLQAYPRIKRRVGELNQQLHTWSIVTTVIFSCNILFSSILIFNFFYDGFRSITTLLANVLLVSTKLHTMTTTLSECNAAKLLALSTIHTRPISYNTVDLKYSQEPMSTGKYKLHITIDDAAIKDMHTRNTIAKHRQRSKSLQ